MFDARQTRRSPRRASQDSENECEGGGCTRLSVGSNDLGNGRPCGVDGVGTSPSCLAPDCISPSKTPLGSSKARPPLTAANNGGDPSPPPPAVRTDGGVAPAVSMKKPPTKPGVSRFGFKQPVGTSLSPRRPTKAAGAAAAAITNSAENLSVITRVASSMLSPTRSTYDSGASDVIDAYQPTSAKAFSGSKTVGTRSRAATAGPVVRSTRGTTAAAAAAAGVSTRGGRRPGTTAAGTGRATTRSAAAASSKRTSMDKRSQPIPVSGRMTRTATKVKPRLEFSHKVSIGGSGMASPTGGRSKRSVRDVGGGSKRVHKSPRTSIDRDYTPSRSRTPTGMGGGVRLHAQRIFTVSDEEVEELLKVKVKGASKWDYKTRIHNQNELLSQIRGMLYTMLQQKQRFTDACIDIEAALKAEMRQVNSRCEDVERDHVELLDENARFQSMEATLKADLKLAAEDRAALRAEREKFQGQVDALKQELNRAESSAIKLEARVADGEARVGEAETQLAMAREKLAWAEAKAGAALTQKEQEWEARMDSATSEAHQEVEVLTARLEGKEMELEALREDNADMLEKTADFREELALAQGRAKEALAALERCRADLLRLEDGQARAQAALDAKNLEMSSTLTSFANSQRAADEREAEMRETRRGLENRVVSLEAEKADLAGQLASRDSGMASLTTEINLLKEQLTSATKEAVQYRGELVESNMKAMQATDALEVEKRACQRAEMKEEEERRERTATTAQLMAMQAQHTSDLEKERKAKAALEMKAALKLQQSESEKGELKRQLVAAHERSLELEGEVRSLKAAVEDAQTNAEQLEEMSRAQGELDVIRHRLEALSREKDSVAIDASAKIEELESKVLEGELQRRKMHNLIQELRGNVRVFARVRPFLPSDNVAPGEAPAVVSKGDGVGCSVTKRLPGGPDGGDYVAETQSFSFDKCFPPSSGQEEVFAEVSEFVQSALDGFNVCLFSYGQTGSGKTHTMQGSGAGPMRGMIPRAMEQVGKYKTKLEAQGWAYEMQVSFLEIYNEQIRDLLRDSEGSKDVKHEIKRDARGTTTVTDLTLENVDPNDSLGVEDIMQRAACHRSVGRTDMNERSSRSHSVFTLYLKAVNQQQRSSLKGTLHLVDLAGSERLSRSNATGDRLKETVAINKSLSSLTDVFVSISNKNSHIPFRNSKLTYLLQPALSGDGKTLMMVNLSPTDQSYHETLCSLRFASQVNQCELGRPKRNLRDMESSSPVAPSASTASSRATNSRKGSGNGRS